MILTFSSTEKFNFYIRDMKCSENVDIKAYIAVDRATDLRFAGRGFESIALVALRKLFAPVCLCHQAV